MKRFPLLSLALALAASATPVVAQQLEIHVINVGQGLSVFVKSPTGTRFLVDGANPGDGNAIVRPYLTSQGVTDLDYSVCTHWHTDHMGGLDEVFNGGFKPNVAAFDRGDTNKPSNPEVTGYMNAVSGVRQIATIGQTIALGGGATAQITTVNGQYLTGSVDPTSSGQEENSRSISLVLRYGDFDCYIGGDVTANADGSTANVEGPSSLAIGQCEVAISAHHGSPTSSSATVVSAINPSFVVHSCGDANPYQHPAKQTINAWNTLAATRVQWSTTEGDTNNGSGGFNPVEGHVVIKSDGNRFTVTRSSGSEVLDFATFEQPGATVGVGDLAVSEVLVNPAASSDLYGEWFELVNVDAAERDLAGVKVTSGAKTFTIASHLLLAPSERIVIGVDGNRTRNGNVFEHLGAPWENFGLADTTSSILVKTPTNSTIETVGWGTGGFPVTSGVSAERRVLTNAPTASNFAAATSAWAGADLGTPGEANDAEVPACPSPVPYGTGKITSQFGQPTVLWSGTPSLLTNDFEIVLNEGVPNKPCIAFWGTQSAALPFYNGTLYVKPPVVRFGVTVIDSVGDASYSVPVDASMAGTTRYYQFWMRDPAQPDGTSVGLSNGLAVTFCPLPPVGLAAGDVIVTEVMKDPAFVADSVGEWLELYNNSSQTLDLEGWTLRDDGGEAHTLVNGGAGLVLGPGDFLVLGASTNTGVNGGIPVAYAWSGFHLDDTDDELVLVAPGGLEVERIAYSTAGWPSTPGAALNLNPGLFDGFLNDLPGSWCDAQTTIAGSTDKGTPGAPNTACP
ncbi:MAG: lamin tail domain-containing protein [Planctomycetes bacterium]|nr:lamin tail domain-containing protein [Planctomycetota bacterium]